LVASDADPSASRKSIEHKLSLETRIALIGVVGALAGALVGGLITWKVTQEQLSSQKADARRAERLDAYSTYFGDAARLWTQAIDIAEVTPRQTMLSNSQAASLRTLEETLTREYAVVALLAPDSVRNVARKLNAADTEVGNALQTSPIEYGAYREAVGKAASGPNNLLAQFEAAAQRDLGTSTR
jgi:hypothetical protein